MEHDLILRNGRVLDPGTGLDAVADIGFAAGKVAAIGPGPAPPPGGTWDRPGRATSRASAAT